MNWTKRSWQGCGGIVTTECRSDVVEHGVRDEKGRAVGNYAVILSYSDRDGFQVTTQATRDGKKFGAINVCGVGCATLEAAEKTAERKIAAAGVRFVRLFGGAS